MIYDDHVYCWTCDKHDGECWCRNKIDPYCSDPTHENLTKLKGEE